MTVTSTASLAPVPSLSPVMARQLAETPASQPQPSPPKTLTYASPVYQFDNLANISIEIFRDPTTGATTNQLPPADVVKKYELGQLRSSSVGNAAGPSTSSPPPSSPAVSAQASVTANSAGVAAAAALSAPKAPSLSITV